MSRALRSDAATLTRPSKRSVRLFVSYSHHNKVWMDHLRPLLDGFQYDDRLARRPGLEFVHSWHDQELSSGNHWDDEIREELETMDIFVPLLSSHFFSSTYIQKVELQRAKERHAAGEILVVPILLYEMNLRERSTFLHSFRVFPALDRWWNSYTDKNDAHRLIDDGLWEAIDEALRRKSMRRR